MKDKKDPDIDGAVMKKLNEVCADLSLAVSPALAQQVISDLVEEVTPQFVLNAWRAAIKPPLSRSRKGRRTGNPESAPAPTMTNDGKSGTRPAA